MEFPVVHVFFLSSSLFHFPNLVCFSPYCPCPLIVPSGLVAVARAVFIHPGWEAEGHQGSNSPSALGTEEMCGSMAGIPEPPQSKETPEWWVKMVMTWDRAGLSHFAEGTVMVFSVLGDTAMSLPTKTWDAAWAWLAQLVCWTVRKITCFPWDLKKKLYNSLDENLHIVYCILTEISVRRMYSRLRSVSLWVFLIISQITAPMGW